MEKEKTSRRTKNDLGVMYIVGNGQKGDGSNGCYKLTNKSESIKSDISNITLHAEKYYNSIGLASNVNETRTKCCHEKMRSGEFFVSSIIKSRDLINAAHYGVNDTCVSIATWTEKKVGMAKDWYFILPNTTFDGEKGIVIPLRHGVTIRWDGRRVYHCLTVGSLGEKNSVYGTYFGTK